MIEQLTIPIFNDDLLLLIEPTLEEIEDIVCNDHNRNRFTNEELVSLKEELESKYAGFVRKLERGGQIMLIKHKNVPSYFIHELIHVANNTLKSCDIPFDDNMEIMAYLVGWLVNSYYNIVFTPEERKPLYTVEDIKNANKN